MTTHDDNLARVKALRDDLKALRGKTSPSDPYEAYAATLTYLEDVLNRHQPWAGTEVCAREGVTWPCADYASALALLDALDGGTDE